MTLINALTFAASLTLSSSSPSVYLAEFSDQKQKIKTKISFHHALLASEDDGLLLELTNKEVRLLEKKGITLTAADKKWQKKLSTIQRRSSANQMGGIPGFNCYETVEETFTEADKLVIQNPNLAQWIDIGDSWQKINGDKGYDLKVLKIGKQSLIDPPILFIQSAMHAREYTTAALTLDFAKNLLQNYDSDPDINWILNRHQIHILFQTNPDGRKIAETGVFQRKNVNINHCSQGHTGIDLNRNFSFGWNTVDGGSSGNDCDETYRGTHPASEPEVSAIEAYVRSIYPDVRGESDTDAAPIDTKGLYLDIHSYSELILWPFGHTETLAPNNKGLQALGRKLAYFNGYDPGQSVGLYPTDGTSDNLAYGELGIAHITFELGTAFFQSCNIYNNKIKPDNLKALLYAAKAVEAPYLITSGPDIASIEITDADDIYITIDVLATDEQFSTKGGIEAKQNINKVWYSIGAYPNEENSLQAEIKDGAADTSKEVFTARIKRDDLVNDQITVYFKGEDSSNSQGPVSAKTLTLSQPIANADINCQGAKCHLLGKEIANSYLWQLEDGRTSINKATDFIFPSLGSYQATYTVTNSIGLHTTQNYDFTVTELLKPDIKFSAICSNITCKFDASDTIDLDSDNLIYKWDFGDSTYSDTMVTSHDYASTGNFTVTLTVTDEHNQTSVLTQEIITTQVVTQEPTLEKTQSSGGSFIYNLLILIVFLRVKHK
ncbi:M14 family zinc carboxypeptidase [Pseudoalteromonas denitrificans]|uniref:carboxypeptidase T n=1 Tax=Pseudoalteromonas denitrificans DSM 6059 TaxID=1123010 RepID=A0A1I1PFJ5_9GAMM|nr:M14 family zinc carboxypeptidase [Pseudoalteromonas denitrificans]SFD08611.1 PKD domain-containing protein [Pseudoalteromonas denitrificans DSM 6059]